MNGRANLSGDRWKEDREQWYAKAVQEGMCPHEARDFVENMVPGALWWAAEKLDELGVAERHWKKR